MRKIFIFLFTIFGFCVFGQNALSGFILNKTTEEPVPFAILRMELENITAQANADGFYEISTIKTTPVLIEISSLGFRKLTTKVTIQSGHTQNFYLLPTNLELTEAQVTEANNTSNRTLSLKKIEGTAIYASKKSELIKIDGLAANLSGNNARQAFARVPGVNVWESDNAGLQLGVGARGLSPDRTSNFNMRQNGYDIAADALGYPESYYAPPMQALERIEIVRGAASLQYGTQFGGMINLKIKEGPSDKKLSVGSINTYNSVGYFNTFNELGGQIGKVNYYAFANHRTGSGFRDNTDFYATTLYAGAGYQATKKLNLKAEITHMQYLAQQAGGLTDVQFQQDPYQSFRTRNWFAVKWKLFALTGNYDFTERTTLNTRFFGLTGSREALGNLQSPVRQDGAPFTNRDLLVDNYNNIGNETRVLHRYTIQNLPSAFVAGFRYYRGNTQKQQGFGSDDVDADFTFVKENRNLLSDYDFPSSNIAVFSENIFTINERLSITPGIRYDNITTRAEGYYDSSVRIPLTGEIVLDSTTSENRLRTRNLLLVGIGASFQLDETLEFYANGSQNYRAITFNNLRVISPAFAVDADLQDESGYNIDLGIRGNALPYLSIDAGLFLLSYEDRIGSILTKVQDNVGNTRLVRFTTNIADARIFGLETYAELDVNKLFELKKTWQLALFNNLALIRAFYLNSAENGVDGNVVENVPTINLKSGLRFTKGNFESSLQFSYLSKQFSDASNAERSGDGLVGIIPSFWVVDISTQYQFKWLKLETGINNATNNAYFTRRAVGYPGPGIIPASPLNFYIGAGFSF